PGSMVPVFWGVLLLLNGYLHAQNPRDSWLNKLRHDVGFLAHDSLLGRQTGSPSERKAAAYLAQEFESMGLKPAGDSGTWYQSFGITVRQEPNPNSTLRVGRRQLRYGEHFRVLPGSANGFVWAKGIDAGYGIQADSLGHNDLSDTARLKGRIWWIRWNGPSGSNPHGPWGSHLPLSRKIAWAERYGAAAVVLFPGSAGEPWPDTVFDRRTRSSSIPVLSLTPEGVAALPTDFFGSEDRLRLEVSVQAHQVVARNVAAFMDRGAPRTLVLGAHYDHLGYGEYGGSRHRGEPQIHNGADDNASGTAGLLALARYWAQQEESRFNFLFLAFSGEEMGLLGSAYFVRHPVIPLDSVVAMFNMDMIGRLQDSTRQLGVHGTGTALEWMPMVDSLAGPLRIKVSPAGTGSSDHQSFYLQNVPVLHFFTGTHEDYHKPSDDADRLNYQGMQLVLEYIIRLVRALPQQGRLSFRKTQNTENQATPRFRLTLGIMPDYFYEGEGVKVDGVTEGKPAALAGVRQGDTLLGLWDFVVRDMQTYMTALAGMEIGKTVTLRVQRNGSIVELQVRF
ncbi:MAG: M28 family peptidase, partial [Bacteroidota bacterium]